MPGRTPGKIPERPGWERLGTNRFETFLRNLLNIKGQAAPDLEPALQAGIDLSAPPWQLAESALAAGWRGFDCSVDSAAVAGQYSWFEIRPGFASIVVVERVTLYPFLTAFVTMGVRDTRTGGAAVTNVGTVDNRYGSIASVTAIPNSLLFAGADVAVPGIIGTQYVMNAGSNSFAIEGPWILAPGLVTRTFQVLGTAVNQRLLCTVRFWERLAEPPESALR